MRLLIKNRKSLNRQSINQLIFDLLIDEHLIYDVKQEQVFKFYFCSGFGSNAFLESFSLPDF